MTATEQYYLNKIADLEEENAELRAENAALRAELDN